MDEYLTVNDIFSVYGLRFSKKVTYVYIFNDEHIFEVPIDMFEIIDNNVPSEWKIQIEEDGEITLWPELFYKDSFIENFAEREDHVRTLFKKLRKKMEK